MAAALVAVLGLLPLALGFHPYYLSVLSTALLFATLATAWNLLALGGAISFGHAAFFGLGAYGAALTALRGVSPWAAIAVGGGAAVLGALVIGAAAVRLRGASLALATLAYAELWRGIALNWTAVSGGGAGLVGIPPLPIPAGLPGALTRGPAGGYYVALAVLAAALALVAGVRRSRLGLALDALREAPERAMLVGLRPIGWMLAAFALSAGLTGLAGGLYAHTVRVVEPDLAFSRSFSILPLVLATVGGLDSLLGPAVAALLLHLSSELLLHPIAPALHQLPYALALIAVILGLPGGLASLRGLRLGRG
jgi:branched-chain amino acid transport system permease protein